MHAKPRDRYLIGVAGNLRGTMAWNMDFEPPLVMKVKMLSKMLHTDAV